MSPSLGHRDSSGSLSVSVSNCPTGKSRHDRKKGQAALPLLTKNTHRYEAKAGKPFPVFCPDFHDKKPNVADLSIGVALYFDTLRLLSNAFLLIFIFTIPSVIITFVANASTAEGTLSGGLSGLTLSRPPPTARHAAR